MAEHELKTWPAPFEAVMDGLKHHEIRRADRQFDIGDTLLLREWDPDIVGHPTYGVPAPRGYTGRWWCVRVTYISAAGTWGLPPDLCVMSIESAMGYREVKVRDPGGGEDLSRSDQHYYEGAE